MIGAALLGLWACSDERGVQPAEAEVGYAGYVFASPELDADGAGAVLSAGEVAFTVLSGERSGEEIAASQPYPAYPGWWAASLPAGGTFALRVAGEGMYPARWLGVAPQADGGWYTGALTGAEPGWFDALFLAADPSARLPSAGAIHLWGVPSDPENWDCAAVTVQAQPVRCFVLSEDGATLTPVAEGAFDWFFALDLAPGAVLLDSGLGWEASYTAEAGDVVMALWLRGVAE